jgi:hypothetical protein
MQFTQCGCQRFFARINPALRHLPGMVVVDMFGASFGHPAPDHDQVETVDQHNAHTGPIG